MAKTAAKKKPKAKAPMTHDELVDKLIHLERHNNLFDLNYVHLYIEEGHYLILSLLESEGIDPTQVTPSICRTAKALHRKRWRQEMLDWNNDPTKILKIVIPGDSDFDPTMQGEINPLGESGAPIPPVTPKKLPDAAGGILDDIDPISGMLGSPKVRPPEPCYAVREAQAATPKALAAARTFPEHTIDSTVYEIKEVIDGTATVPANTLKDGDKIRVKAQMSSDKQPPAKKTKGAKLFGFSLSSVIRWVAAQYKKQSQEALEAKAKKLVKHFGLKAEENTIKCQVRAGRKGTNYYGPLPKIDKNIASAILKILDKK